MTEGYLVRVSSAEQPGMYWVFATIPIDAPLKLLDDFLRETWLECCGHLSEFVIGSRTIFSRTESGNLSQAMKSQIGKLLSPGATCKYTYDMGSSTELEIQIVEKIDACPQKKVTLLMRNEPPTLSCESCEKVAKTICGLCGDTVCSRCSKRHSCVVKEGNDYMLMPLVNSPRAGVCGYVGT